MKKTKRVRVNYRLPEELVKWVKKQAKKRGQTATDVVVRSINMYKAHA